jgi:hypothetical protein
MLNLNKRDDPADRPQAPQRFFVSTGDIREKYETLNVVMGVGIAPAHAFAPTDHAVALRQAMDAMALEAQRIGANGVIWISFAVTWDTMLVLRLVATGTAVKVG